MKRAPNERVPVGLRLRGELYNRLIDASLEHDRPLGAEVELLLERALNPPVPHEKLIAALTLLSVKDEGLAALVRYLISVDGNPDEQEQARRQMQILRVANNPKPRVEWLEPDKPRYLDEYEEDEEGNLKLVSRVDLDDDGNPIPATRKFL